MNENTENVETTENAPVVHTEESNLRNIDYINEKGNVSNKTRDYVKKNGQNLLVKAITEYVANHNLDVELVHSARNSHTFAFGLDNETQDVVYVDYETKSTLSSPDYKLERKSTKKSNSSAVAKKDVDIF